MAKGAAAPPTTPDSAWVRPWIARAGRSRTRLNEAIPEPPVYQGGGGDALLTSDGFVLFAVLHSARLRRCVAPKPTPWRCGFPTTRRRLIRAGCLTARIGRSRDGILNAPPSSHFPVRHTVVPHQHTNQQPHKQSPTTTTTTHYNNDNDLLLLLPLLLLLLLLLLHTHTTPHTHTHTHTHKERKIPLTRCRHRPPTFSKVAQSGYRKKILSNGSKLFRTSICAPNCSA